MQVQAAANTDASNKGMSEIQTSISGPAAPTDGTKAPTDSTKAPTDNTAASATAPESATDKLGDFAANLWSGASNAFSSTDNAFNSWASKTDDSFLKDVTDLLPAGFTDTPAAAASAGSDAAAVTAAKSAPASDSAAPKPSVEVKDGQITANNNELTATRDSSGTDTVTSKQTGEVTSRDAKGDITDTTNGRTTTIEPGHNGEIDTNVNGAHIKQLNGKLPPDGGHPKPGTVLQGSDGTTYTETLHGGTATVKNDGTIDIKNTAGDNLLLNSKTEMVDYTPKGGQTVHESLQDWEKNYGHDSFAGFHLDDAGSITAKHDGMNFTNRPAPKTAVENPPPAVQAQAAAEASPDAPHDTPATPAAPAAGQPADAPTVVTMTKTNPAGGETTTLTVNPSGTAELKDVGGNGQQLSDTKINYNDPANYYQSLDAQGNVLASYDANSGNYQGQGFDFTAQGMGIADGNVFVGDNGSYSADSSTDSISTDNSLSNFYTGDGSTYGSLALNPQSGTGLSVDDQSAVAADLAAVQTDPTGDIDTLLNLDQLTGGKLNLQPLIDRAEEKEEWKTARQDRLDRRDQNKDNTVLDFAAADIYGNSAA